MNHENTFSLLVYLLFFLYPFVSPNDDIVSNNVSNIHIIYFINEVYDLN